MNCMWNSIFIDNKCKDCSQCPIQKYDCCTSSRADAEKLIYKLNGEMKKILSIRKKIIDKLSE